MLKHQYFKYVIYSLLFLFLLTPVVVISLPMKTLNVSSEATRIGTSDDIKVAAKNDNTWTNKTNPSGDKPSKRYGQSMVYDSAHDRAILFGGQNGGTFDDTWVYNYAKNSWTNVTTAGDKPSARSYISQSMAYDSINDRTILFGGYDYKSDYLDDTWVYNYTDNSWTNVTTAGDKPTKRDEVSMAYDSANNLVVLFGGYDDVIGDTIDDTWVYNYTDNSWTNVTTAGDKPSARYGQSMVYDSKQDRMILFGGKNGGTFDDTWVYNYTDNSWTNMTTAGDNPSPRYWHSMVYDSINDRTILFGGYDGSKELDDTWVYNYAKNSWTNLTTAGDKPSPREMHSMVYDSAHNRAILFGGSPDSFVYLDDTWVYCFAEIPSSPLPPAADDDDDDDDEDTGAVVVVVVIIIIACVGGVVVVIIVLIKKGIIGTSKLNRG